MSGSKRKAKEKQKKSKRKAKEKQKKSKRKAKEKQKKSRMGCVAATAWFCQRLPSFSAVRYSLWNEKGEYSEHVVATNGVIEIDFAPYARAWEE